MKTRCHNDGCANPGMLTMTHPRRGQALVCSPHFYVYHDLGWQQLDVADEALPMSLRTPETEARYQKAKAAGRLVPLAEVTSMRAWKYWRLIPNGFPYDAVFSKHDMLVPKRVFAQEEDMTLSELHELQIIKFELKREYDLYLANTPTKQSVTNHYHLHWGTYHIERKDI